MKTQTPTSSEIRAWARGAGLEVGDRGRLSPAVLDAYNRAHGGSPVKAAATKAPAKKAPAKKAAAGKATARKAPAKKAPVRNGPSTSAPRPAAVQHEAPAAAPVVTADSELITSLENQIKALATRIERLEEARAASASQARGGLFRKKG